MAETQVVRIDALDRAELPEPAYREMLALARSVYKSALALPGGDHDKALMAVFLTGAVQGHHATADVG